MTIDERLERLTERHEALTQSVELMAADNRQRAEDDKRRWQENNKLIGQIMQGIASLLHTAEIHEHRISELEGGNGEG